MSAICPKSPLPSISSPNPVCLPPVRLGAAYSAHQTTTITLTEQYTHAAHRYASFSRHSHFPSFR